MVVLCLLGISCSELDEDTLVGKTQQAWTKREFGVWAAKYFDDPNIATLAYAYGLTNNFAYNLDDTDTRKFYYELYNTTDMYYWYDDNVAGTGWDTVEGVGNDTVDLVFAATHGGFTSSYAQWAMRPQNYFVHSYHMRLGDDGHNSILAVYACNSMRDDAYLVNRWANAFYGGMRMGLGAHGNAGAGAGEAAIGTTFADSLQAGYKIWNARGSAEPPCPRQRIPASPWPLA